MRAFPFNAFSYLPLETEGGGYRPAQSCRQGKDGRNLYYEPGSPNQTLLFMYNSIQEQLDRIERNTLLAAKKALTFEDVHLLTVYSKSHLYKLTCTNQIPYYKPNGKNLYFDKTEIENWLLQNRANTDAEAEQAAVKYMAEGGRQLL